MPYTSGTVTATGAGTAVTDTALDGYGPASMGVVIFSGTYTAPAVTVEKKIRGSSVWVPLAMTDEKTMTRTAGTATLGTNTTTSFRVDLGGAGAWRAYPTSGTVSSGMLIELASGAVEDFGGILPAVYTTNTAATAFGAGISFTGATGANDVSLTDNLADALDITEGSNSYLKFRTTNSAEAILPGKAVAGMRQAAGTTAALITGATTLVLADSGGTFLVDQDAAFDIDLPSPTTGEGCVYNFVVHDVGTNNVTITVDGDAATFIGNIHIDGATVVATGSTLTFASGSTAVGDWIEIRSLTTGLYHVKAMSATAGGITIS